MYAYRYLLFFLFLLLAGLTSPATALDDPPPAEPEWAPDEPTTPADYWDARIGLGAIGDSNPSLLAEAFPLSIPDSRRLVRGGESDRATTADLSFSLHPFARGDDDRIWHFGLQVDGHQSHYENLDFFDLGEASVTLHLARGSSPSGFLSGPQGGVRVPIGLSRTTVLLQGSTSEATLDRELFFRASWGSASFAFRPRPAYAVQLDLEAQDRRFPERQDSRRNGTEIRAGLVQTFFLGREDRTLRVSAQAGHRDADRPFSTQILRGQIELALPLAARWDLLASATVQRDNYDHPESDIYFSTLDENDPEFNNDSHVERTVRRDRSARAALALVWTWRSRLQVIGRMSLLDHDSNLRFGTNQPLDYRRTLSSLGFAWNF
ncbi:MAG TPA: hypothetical protein VGS22_13195 [Thermoanaerobaculia bacterium]|jgi:hypothetical protein|nr:hypothetical protein [Thermoanaerobaculia bacterium]